MSAPTIAVGNYSEVIFTAMPRAMQPFNGLGDNNDYIFEQDCQQLASAFTPAALNTPHPDIAGTYLVAEGNARFDGALRLWTRTYAKIPATRTYPESYSWTRPGLGFGGTNPIIGIASISAPDSGFVDITTDAAHSLVSGDKIFFYFQNEQSIYKPQSVFPIAITVIDTLTVRARATGLGAFYTNAISLQKSSLGRQPETISVDTTVVFDYWLVDPTAPAPDFGAHIVQTPEQIPILRAPVVTDEFDQQLSPPSYRWNTQPDIAEYLLQVDDAEPIVCQDSAKHIWQGSIIERATRYVAAQ